MYSDFKVPFWKYVETKMLGTIGYVYFISILGENLQWIYITLSLNRKYYDIRWVFVIMNELLE